MLLRCRDLWDRCYVTRLKELSTLAKTRKWKIQKLRFFFNVWGQKMNDSTTVNSWKRLQRQIPIEMQVMSKCDCHKTLEGLQNCKLRCWKKGQIAQGHCGQRDLFLYLPYLSNLSIYLSICFSICFLSIYRSFYRPFLSIYLLYPTYRSILSDLPNLLI